MPLVDGYQILEESPLPRIVTLTSDFGLQDAYAGILRGVIISQAPEARVVDLSHEVPPYNVRRAAAIVADSYPYFPEGTVHLAVVDPGVGGAREIVVVRAAGQFFLAPDNGLLSCVVTAHPQGEARYFRNNALIAGKISATFHGRDIFAPLAAHLLNGGPFTEIGPLADLQQLSILADTRPVFSDDGTLKGEIDHVDSFGNAISNIEAADLAVVASKGEMTAVLGDSGYKIRGVGLSYQDAPPGEPLMLVNSSGRLEIAVNQGSAADHLGLIPGDTLILRES